MTANGNPYPFVVLEGLSATGKTAVSKALAEMIRGTVYTTPPEPFSQIRDDIDKACGLSARYFFYLSSVLHASDEIQDLLAIAPVICDRYVLTSHCYHRAAGVRTTVPLESLSIVQPDLTILLTCAESERQRRLAARGLSYNDAIEEVHAIHEAFLAEYHAREAVEVDTTALLPSEVAAHILALLPPTKRGFSVNVSGGTLGGTTGQ